jgi:hypothetical protein
MPENFDNYYTVEILTDKGWEVIRTYLALADAFHKFLEERKSQRSQVRITSPKW